MRHLDYVGFRRNGGDMCDRTVVTYGVEDVFCEKNNVEI